MVVTTSELLHAWPETTRAAELAQRLADNALATSERADQEAAAAEELAILAERAAQAAENAARSARTAATRLAAFAQASRETGLPEARATLEDAERAERHARDMYHEREREARERTDPPSRG